MEIQEARKMDNSVISVHNLVKKFGNFIANDNLSFEVYEGEIFGFLGANGAGKTTAIRILSGLSSHSGEVMLQDLMQKTGRKDKKEYWLYVSEVFIV